MNRQPTTWGSSPWQQVASPFGWRGVAQRLGGKIDTHVTALANEGGPAATRWYYRQRIEAKLRRKERPWVLLVDPGATAPAPAGGGAAPAVERVSAALPAARTQVTGVRAPSTGEQTIRPDAKLLFVAGAGWTKKQPDGKPHPEKAEELILGFIRAAGSATSIFSSAGAAPPSGFTAAQAPGSTRSTQGRSLRRSFASMRWR